MLQWMWECICLLEAVFLCSPNQYWVEPLPGHVVVVFIFSGTSIPFVTVAAPFSIPSNSAVSPRLHTLDHTWCLSLGQLPFQPLSGDSRLWVWLKVSLAMISDVEPLFLSVGTCAPSLESIYSHILPIFYTVFICFDLYECCVSFGY